MNENTQTQKQVRITYGRIILGTVVVGLIAVVATLGGAISSEWGLWLAQVAVLFAAWLFMPAAAFGEPAFTIRVPWSNE